MVEVENALTVLGAVLITLPAILSLNNALLYVAISSIKLESAFILKQRRSTLVGLSQNAFFHGFLCNLAYALGSLILLGLVMKEVLG